MDFVNNFAIVGLTVIGFVFGLFLGAFANRNITIKYLFEKDLIHYVIVDEQTGKTELFWKSDNTKYEK